MFKEGDIVVPSMNNMESVFEKPVPQYRICEISMGRVWAQNMITGEIGNIGPMESAVYYYDKVPAKKKGRNSTRKA